MITIPVFIICFVIFIAWTQYEMKKSSKIEKQREDAFWQREYEANHAPKQDISGLDMITFDESVIPMPPEGAFTEQDDVSNYIKELKRLLREPMLDLTEFTNTDLKLAYGIGNFKTLSDYDENYSSFLMLMTNLARGYARRDMHELSIQTYRSALECGSIKLHDYTGLAEEYLAIDDPASVGALIEEVEASENPRKQGIVDELKKVLAKY